jgi:hypothetical protein
MPWMRRCAHDPMRLANPVECEVEESDYSRYFFTYAALVAMLCNGSTAK